MQFEFRGRASLSSLVMANTGDRDRQMLALTILGFFGGVSASLYAFSVALNDRYLLVASGVITVVVAAAAIRLKNLSHHLSIPESGQLSLHDDLTAGVCEPQTIDAVYSVVDSGATMGQLADGARLNLAAASASATTLNGQIHESVEAIALSLNKAKELIAIALALGNNVAAAERFYGSAKDNTQGLVTLFTDVIDKISLLNESLSDPSLRQTTDPNLVLKITSVGSSIANLLAQMRDNIAQLSSEAESASTQLSTMSRAIPHFLACTDDVINAIGAQIHQVNEIPQTLQTVQTNLESATAANDLIVVTDTDRKKSARNITRKFARNPAFQLIIWKLVADFFEAPHDPVFVDPDLPRGLASNGLMADPDTPLPYRSRKAI